MNHLAHLALAGGEAQVVVGSFIGDFVKGRLRGEYPTGVEKGIRLHRAIDAYTDQHPQVRAAGRCLPSEYRRYAGIITDIAFDHFLAIHWQRHHPQPLAEFSAQTLALLCRHKALMPPTAAALAMRMQAAQSLAHYASPSFPQHALQAIAKRLSRKNPLATAPAALQAAREPLEAAFQHFYPQVAAFAEDWLAERKGE